MHELSAIHRQVLLFGQVFNVYSRSALAADQRKLRVSRVFSNDFPVRLASTLGLTVDVVSYGRLPLQYTHDRHPISHFSWFANLRVIMYVADAC